jgi:hypothetical protein
MTSKPENLLQVDNSQRQLILKDSLTASSCSSIASSNGFLERLGDIMADDTVRSFFGDYFTNWSDGKAALMLIHAYNLIDEAYAKQNDGARLPSEQIIPLVRRAIANGECRKVLCGTMQRYLDDDVSAFSDLLLKEQALSQQPAISPQ